MQQAAAGSMASVCVVRRRAPMRDNGDKLQKQFDRCDSFFDGASRSRRLAFIPLARNHAYLNLRWDELPYRTAATEIYAVATGKLRNARAKYSVRWRNLHRCGDSSIWFSAPVFTMMIIDWGLDPHSVTCTSIHSPLPYCRCIM